MQGLLLSPIFPQRFRSQRRVRVSVTRIFLEGAAGSARPSKGVSSIVAHFGLRSVQFCCFALTTFSGLAFARLQYRRLFCKFTNYPMALGLARNDPLAGARALDAYFVEGEGACAPMERGTLDSGPPSRHLRPLGSVGSGIAKSVEIRCEDGPHLLFITLLMVWEIKERLSTRATQAGNFWEMNSFQCPLNIIPSLSWRMFLQVLRYVLHSCGLAL